MRGTEFWLLFCVVRTQKNEGLQERREEDRSSSGQGKATDDDQGRRSVSHVLPFFSGCIEFLDRVQMLSFTLAQIIEKQISTTRPAETVNVPLDLASSFEFYFDHVNNNDKHTKVALGKLQSTKIYLE